MDRVSQWEPLAEHYHSLIRGLGEDPDREGLREPRSVQRGHSSSSRRVTSKTSIPW